MHAYESLAANAANGGAAQNLTNGAVTIDTDVEKTRDGKSELKFVSFIWFLFRFTSLHLYVRSWRVTNNVGVLVLVQLG